MKRAKTKIVSALLVLITIISASPAAFAAAIVATPKNNEVFVQYDGHGQYTEVPSAVRTNITQEVNSQETGRVVIATATEDKDLYFLSQNDYLLRVGELNDTNRTFLHVERNDVDIDNFSADELREFNFPDELVDRITSGVNAQIAMGNDAFGLSVFSPKSSRETQSATLQGGASTQSTRESWDDYYTRFGQRFTDSYIKYRNYSCEYSDNSKDAWKKASALVSFAIDVAGKKIKTIPAFQFGYSALKTLAIALGVEEVGLGNGYGSIQVIVTYDAISRITYWNLENGVGTDPYVSTCKAWLNTNFTQQTHDDYPSGGYQTQHFINEEAFSDHYDDPSAWLYNEYYDAEGVIEGPLYHTILDNRYMLV